MTPETARICGRDEAADRSIDRRVRYRFGVVRMCPCGWHFVAKDLKIKDIVVASAHRIRPDGLTSYRPNQQVMTFGSGPR